MNNKKVAFHNLGCKVNSYELDAMTELLVNKGYEMVSFDDMADIYIVNTCSVTNIADRKSRQMLSRARHKNPDAVIVAVGCYVDTCDEEKLKTEGIDLCIGNNRKGRIVSILEEYLAGRTDKNCDVVKADDKDTLYETLHISESAEHSRAFIKIQDGCNQFCSYCIIPYARGRARSRKPEDIIDEIKGLVTRGYREFVINGIHISSYGSDFIYEKSKADQFNPGALLDLLDKINNIGGVYRIRLGSLEPRIVTDDFIKRLAGMDKICGHFHLSLQSGCDRTLERMNRHYNADQYAEGVEIIRRYYTTLNRVVEEKANESEVLKIELLMNQAGITTSYRQVVTKAAERSSQTDGHPAVAIELPDGTVVTGKTGDLLGAAASALLNALKELAGIDHELDLVSATSIAPIQKLKIDYLGSHNPRLHTDEILIALSTSAADNELAARALEQLPKLNGCDAHSTVILSSVDDKMFKRLGIQLTCEPKYEEEERLYHKS